MPLLHQMRSHHFMSFLHQWDPAMSFHSSASGILPSNAIPPPVVIPPCHHLRSFLHQVRSRHLMLFVHQIGSHHLMPFLHQMKTRYFMPLLHQMESCHFISFLHQVGSRHLIPFLKGIGRLVTVDNVGYISLHPRLKF